jgi:hypothetical protein
MRPRMRPPFKKRVGRRRQSAAATRDPFDGAFAAMASRICQLTLGHAQQTPPGSSRSFSATRSTHSTDRPRGARTPSSRTPRRPRSPVATHPTPPAGRPLPDADAHARATNRRTTAGARSDHATPASRRGPTRGSSGAQSRLGGTPCNRRTRPPCRCAATCRRRSRGTGRRSGPSPPSPFRRSDPKRPKGASVHSGGEEPACRRSPETSSSFA